MLSMFQIEEGMPRLRSRVDDPKVDLKTEREIRTNNRDSTKPRKKTIAPPYQVRRLGPDIIAETKRSKKRKPTEEPSSVLSGQGSRQTRREGGKTRLESHQEYSANKPSPMLERRQSSNSPPTSIDTDQREPSNETISSSKETPVASPLELDGRRRDIDGEIIESPDSDGHEYIGEDATKAYSSFGKSRDKPQRKRKPQKKRKAQKKRKVHNKRERNVQQEVVHAKKVWTNLAT